MAPLSEIELFNAPAETQSILRDVQQVLRFGDVPWLFRVLAGNPRSLTAAWTAIKPALTDYFERAGCEVRSLAVAQTSALLSASNLKTNLKKPGMKDELFSQIAENILAYHFVNPKLLLISKALNDALEERPSIVNSIVVFPTGRGVPLGMPKIGRAAAGPQPKSKEILHDAAKLQGGSANSDLLQTLAQWPEVLSLIWESLKSAMQSSHYGKALEKIDASATEGAHHLQRRMDLGREQLSLLGISEPERAEILTLAKQACRYYLTATADAAYLTQSLLGQETASLSREALLIRWALPAHR